MKIIFILLFCIGLGLSIPLLAQDNPALGFISIDCGASNAYTDSNFLIRYET
ncbi:hypothetical protein SAY86_006739 [Trapa natans]|uniref:Uncharacterized protein n=1 Tax=Trapa natans TaxID=22666 RepID=A0AAN7LE98_TRANT|nr:hypothetical protein SAY86_006739 [Trapa natans]